jgi:hypothetical protein
MWQQLSGGIFRHFQASGRNGNPIEVWERQAQPKPVAWIIHEVSSQKRKDALKGMMNTGFADPAFPFGASIA